MIKYAHISVTNDKILFFCFEDFFYYDSVFLEGFLYLDFYLV